MTTIISVRIGSKVSMGGDGQATLGNTIIKNKVKKIRFLYNKKIIAGFAGNTSDAINLFEKIERKLKLYKGKIKKSAIELVKEWRNDKMMQKFEAMLIISDKKTSLLISGNGDIIKPDNNVIAIGSGGCYAQAAAYALIKNTKLSPYEIVKKSLKIASKICIYTNNKFNIKKI